jgi:hypothetical protein
MQRWVLVLVAACASPATHHQEISPPIVASPTCDDMTAKIRSLYTADAQQKEPKRVDEAVADNTSMVLKDCQQDPAKAIPCIQAAQTTADLEKQCLIPLDPEGTEGDRLGR